MKGFGKCAYGLCVIALGSMLGGCSSLHLYSEKRAEQGATLQKTVDGLDIDKHFAEIRQQRGELVKQELATTRQYVLSVRDAKLTSMLSHPVDEEEKGLRSALAKELTDLAGPGADGDQWLKAAGTLKKELVLLRSQVATHSKEVAFDAALATIYSGGSAGCDAGGVAPGAGAAGNAALQQAQALAARCKLLAQLQQQWSARLELPGGAIEAQRLLVVELERAVADERDKATAQRAVYLQALAAYEQAAANLAAQEDAGALLQQRAEKLRVAMGMLESVGNVFAGKSAAFERLAEIDRLLASLSGAEKPKADDPRLQRALAIVPAIAADVQLAAGHGPQAIRYSVQIRRDIEAVRLRQATQLAALRTQELELARVILQAQVDKLLSLLSAAIALDQHPERKRSLAVDLEAGDEHRRMALATSLAHYLDAMGEQEVRIAVLRQQAEDMRFEKAMLYSEASARQWVNLIGVSAAAANGYAGAGLKVDDFKDLIQTAALLWIGQGVHK